MARILLCTTLAATLFFAGCAAPPADTSDSRAAQVPVFEVDPSWPKVPDKWRLGDGSSIGIDAQDNVYVLHRPRTVKAGESAAPAILVLTPQVCSCARGAGREPVSNGPRESTASTSITRDLRGSAAISARHRARRD